MSASNIQFSNLEEIDKALLQSPDPTFSREITSDLIRQVSFPVFHKYLCSLSQASEFSAYSDADKIKLTVRGLILLNPELKPLDLWEKARATRNRAFPTNHSPTPPRLSKEEVQALHQSNIELVQRSLSGQDIEDGRLAELLINKERDYLDEALHLFLEGDLNGAFDVADCCRTRRLGQDILAALFDIALDGLQDLDAAQRIAQKMIDQDERDRRFALIEEARGAFGQARLFADQIIGSEARKIVLFRLVEAQIREGDIEGAWQALQEIVPDDTTSSGFFKVCKAFASAGAFDKAFALLREKALMDKPQAESMFLNLQLRIGPWDLSKMPPLGELHHEHPLEPVVLDFIREGAIKNFKGVENFVNRCSLSSFSLLDQAYFCGVIADAFAKIGKRDEALVAIRKALALFNPLIPTLSEWEAALRHSFFQQRLWILEGNTEALIAPIQSMTETNQKFAYSHLIIYFANFGEFEMGIQLANALFPQVEQRKVLLCGLFTALRIEGNAEGCRAVMEAMPDEAWRETLRRAWIKSFAPHA